MSIDLNPFTPLIEIGGRIIDKLIPDPEAKARAQLELIRLQQEGAFKEIEVRMSAIIAEASSTDPWTSRARPAFMWCFYLILVALVIVAPLFGIFFAAGMEQFYVNVAAGFAALPEPLWWTFTTGYLGYTAARQYGKAQGTDK